MQDDDDCIARLLALGNQLAYFGKNVTMDFSNAEETRKYLDRSGFFDHLNEDIIVLPDRPLESAAQKYQGQSDTLVEFGPIVQRLRGRVAPKDRLHVFIAAANAFAFFLGQHQQALGPVSIYEWDFDGNRGGSYNLALSVEM